MPNKSIDNLYILDNLNNIMPTLLIKNVDEKLYYKLLELKGKLKCKTYSELLKKLIEISDK